MCKATNEIGFPIVLVHVGSSRVLELMLEQLHKFNPNSPVYLLSENNDIDFDYVTKYSLSRPELSEDTCRFRKVYQHISSLPLEFERLCIERWLITRNFLRWKGFSRCLSLDADVLVFCEVDGESTRFKEYAMTLAHFSRKRCQVMSHCNFIQDVSALESFCDFIFEFYEHPEWISQVAATTNNWVSDMSLFDMWIRQHPEFKIAWFEDFYEQGICFDSMIALHDTVKSQMYLPSFRKHKKVVFIDGLPYGQLKSGLRIPFKILHYQGYFKFLLEYHFNGVHPYWLTLRTLVERRCKKWLNKLLHFSRSVK